jgi:hypothetical protein
VSGAKNQFPRYSCWQSSNIHGNHGGEIFICALVVDQHGSTVSTRAGMKCGHAGVLVPCMQQEKQERYVECLQPYGESVVTIFKHVSLFVYIDHYL